MREKEMSACSRDQRFFLSEKNYVMDKLNPDNNYKAEWLEQLNCPKDEKSLRELLLWRNLGELLPNLIINKNPMAKDHDGKEYQPPCNELYSIWFALNEAIVASHLNTLDAATSLQHEFDGKLKREKSGWQDFSSLSLFADDVERMLRDIYGESENQAIDRVRRAVLCIVREFTRYLREDLWQEHKDTMNIDYAFGIGVPKGCFIHGSDRRRADLAIHSLIRRACAVRANPAAFSEYTVEFVKEMYADPWYAQHIQVAESGGRIVDFRPRGSVPF
jgi:hypothetical protein